MDTRIQETSLAPYEEPKLACYGTLDQFVEGFVPLTPALLLTCVSCAP